MNSKDLINYKRCKAVAQRIIKNAKSWGEYCEKKNKDSKVSETNKLKDSEG